MNQIENYNNRCTAFNLSESKRQAAVSPPKKKSAATTPTGNAYERAFHEVYDKLPAWRKEEITTLKEAGNTDSHFYVDFIKEVAALGDKYHG